MTMRNYNQQTQTYCSCLPVKYSIFLVILVSLGFQCYLSILFLTYHFWWAFFPFFASIIIHVLLGISLFFKKNFFLYPYLIFNGLYYLLLLASTGWFIYLQIKPTKNNFIFSRCMDNWRNGHTYDSCRTHVHITAGIYLLINCCFLSIYMPMLKMLLTYIGYTRGVQPTQQQQQQQQNTDSSHMTSSPPPPTSSTSDGGSAPYQSVPYSQPLGAATSNSGWTNYQNPSSTYQIAPSAPPVSLPPSPYISSSSSRPPMYDIPPSTQLYAPPPPPQTYAPSPQSYAQPPTQPSHFTPSSYPYPSNYYDSSSAQPAYNMAYSPTSIIPSAPRISTDDLPPQYEKR